MQAYADVVFTPKGKQQIKALLKLLDDTEYNVYRNATHNSTAYKLAVNALQQFHRHVYSNPAQYKVADDCLWKTSGLYAQCEEVARQFKIPKWDVVGHANSTT